jgi:hypothetical protein
MKVIGNHGNSYEVSNSLLNSKVGVVDIMGLVIKLLKKVYDRSV